MTSTSFIHKKAKIVKRNIVDSTLIKKWDCLHVEHDNIDHQLDLKLYNAITNINESYSASSSSSSSSSSNKHQHQHQPQHRGRDIIFKQRQQQQYLKPLLHKIESFKNQIESFEQLYRDDGMIKESSLKKKPNSNAELDPSIAYRTGKQLLLTNLVVDQLVLLVDLLIAVELEISSSQEYWMKRTDIPYWYIFEKTPIFWIEYFYDQWTNQLSFLKLLHKKAGLNSRMVNMALKFNQYKIQTKQYLIQRFNHLINNNNPNNNNSNNNNPNNNNNNHNNNEEELNQHNNQPKQQTSKPTVLFPINELEKRLERLNSMASKISISIGRITYSLSLLTSLESTNNGDSYNGKSINHNQPLQRQQKPNELSNYVIHLNQSLILIQDTCETLFNRNEDIIIDEQLNSDVVDSYRKWEIDCCNTCITDMDKLNEPSLEKHQEFLFTLLRENTASMQSMVDRIQGALLNEKPPNFFVRNWSTILIASAATYFGVRYAYNNREEFQASAKEYYTAWRRFSREHIETPLLNIWNVIRYDQKSMNVTDPAALQSSLDSLTRMVIDFCRETKSTMSEAEIIELVKRVSLGDLSDIMKPYEQDIRAPIKSALFGDFLRLALIQVQKEKVDVDRAMLAIDKLLQSNELNFQLLAAIPAVLILWMIAYKINDALTGKESKQTIQAQKSILSTLRSIHRRMTIAKHQDLPHRLIPITCMIVPKYYKNLIFQSLFAEEEEEKIEKSTLEQQTIPFEEYGQLLISIEKMKHFAQDLDNSSNSQEKEWIHQDLQDLESEHLGHTEKLLTIQRMFSTYSFLKK